MRAEGSWREQEEEEEETEVVEGEEEESSQGHDASLAVRSFSPAHMESRRACMHLSFGAAMLSRFTKRMDKLKDEFDVG